MNINDEELGNFISEKIKTRLKEVDMTHGQVADFTTVSRAQISTVLKRERFTLKTLYEICAALDIEPSEILPKLKDMRQKELVDVVIGGKTYRVSKLEADKLQTIADRTVSAA